MIIKNMIMHVYGNAFMFGTFQSVNGNMSWYSCQDAWYRNEIPKEHFWGCRLSGQKKRTEITTHSLELAKSETLNNSYSIPPMYLRRPTCNNNVLAPYFSLVRKRTIDATQVHGKLVFRKNVPSIWTVIWFECKLNCANLDQVFFVLSNMLPTTVMWSDLCGRWTDDQTFAQGFAITSFMWIY